MKLLVPVTLKWTFDVVYGKLVSNNLSFDAIGEGECNMCGIDKQRNRGSSNRKHAVSLVEGEVAQAEQGGCAVSLSIRVFSWL